MELAHKHLFVRKSLFVVLVSYVNNYFFSCHMKLFSIKQDLFHLIFFKTTQRTLTHECLFI